MTVLKKLFAVAIVAVLCSAGARSGQAAAIHIPIAKPDAAGRSLLERATPVHYRGRIGGLRWGHYRRRHYGYRFRRRHHYRRYYARQYYRPRYYARRHYRRRYYRPRFYGYYGYYGPSIYFRAPGFGFYFGY